MLWECNRERPARIDQAAVLEFRLEFCFVVEWHAGPAASGGVT